MKLDNLFASVCLIVMSVVIIMLQCLVAAVCYLHSVCPDITTTIFILFCVYLTYRVVNRIVRMWVNFVISLIKMTIIICTLTFLLGIYLRGYHRFFTKDIFHIYRAFQSAKQDGFDYQTDTHWYAIKLAGRSKFNFLVKKGAQAVFGTDKVTPEQLRNMKDSAEDLITENLEHVKDFLGGLDVGANANYLHNFLHNV